MPGRKEPYNMCSNKGGGLKDKVPRLPEQGTKQLDKQARKQKCINRRRNSGE